MSNSDAHVSTTGPRPQSAEVTWTHIFVVTIGYLLAAWLGLALAIPPTNVIAFWPPAGVALAAACLLGWRSLPALVISAGLADFAMAIEANPWPAGIGSLVHPLSVGLAVAAEAWLGAWLIRRTLAYPISTASAASIIRLFVLGGAASLVTCTVLSVPLLWETSVNWSGVAAFWQMHWVADTLGIVVFAPIILGVAWAPAKRRLRRGLVIGAIAVAAISASGTFVGLKVSLGQRALQAEFTNEANRLNTNVETTLKLGVQSIAGVAGLFQGDSPRSRVDFDAVASPLANFDLGIQQLAWSPKVTAADRARFEAAMSLEWGWDFAIRERSGDAIVRATARPVYFPMAYGVPQRGNEATIGFDLASNDIRVKTMAQADATGQLAATPGIRLLSTGTMGVLLTLPVFSAAASGARKLKGYAVGVFSLPKLVSTALSGSDTSAIDYWLIDETDPAAPKTLVSSRDAEPADLSLRSFGPFGTVSTIGNRFPVSIGGRRWSFQVAPTSAYIAGHMDSDAYVLMIAGMLFTALASAGVLILTDHQDHLLKSREQQLEDQKFALDQHAIVSIVDADGRLTYANDRFCAIAGYARQDLIGKTHAIVCSGVHDPAYFDELQATVRAGRVWRGEICNRDSSGNLYWLSTTSVPMQDAATDTTAYIEISTDITHLKQLENDLQASKSFLQSITDAMAEGVYALDHKGRCMFLNAEAERLIGWTLEEARGRPLHRLIGFEDGDLASALTNIGQYRSDDLQFTDRRGHQFPVSISANRFQSDCDHSGSVVVFNDITARRRFQDALQESQERLNTALDASGTGLWDYNPITDTAYYSDTWYSMLGYAPDAFPPDGDHFFAIMHPEDVPKYVSAINRHIREDQTSLECEFRLRRHDGSWCWIKSAGRIVARDADGQPTRIIGVHTDLSAGMQRRIELANAKDEALAASKAKSNFLATMSHEIRTPMNAIIGLMHLMRKTELSARQHDYADKVMTASKSLLGIINNVLDFSKIESGKLTIERINFSLKDLVDDVTSVLGSKIDEKGLSFKVDLESALPDGFIGDPLRMSQILLNLIGNATKFTERGGVTLVIGGQAIDDKRHRLEISVTDTGIGMSEAQVAALFQPFTQADTSMSRRFGGTGLGLAISGQLADLLGGRISVRSAPGVGSTFKVTLPLDLSDGHAQNPVGGLSHRRRSPKAAADIRLPEARVLLVEDNAINQQVATELLRGLGLGVTVADCGEAAIETLGNARFDLILMDVQMPGIDGYETTSRIRSDLGLTDVPIIALTANAMSDDRQRCLDAGMNDHLAKPIDPDALVLMLSRWFNPAAALDAVRRSIGGEAPARADTAPQVPGIDIALGLANLAGDQALLVELLRQLAEEYQTQGEALTTASQNQDWRALNRTAHTLKSTSASLGASAVAKLAFDVEQLSKPGKSVEPTAIDPLVASLRAEMNIVVASITSGALDRLNTPATGHGIGIAV